MAKNRSTIEQVREFHETYGLPVKTRPDISDPKTNALRINLLAEELDELKEALDAGDILETLDALIDLQYVLDGAFLSFGLHNLKDIAFNEVHGSNMSKLGEDGKPIVRESDGKILKGPNFYQPDLRKFLDSDICDAAE
ncbi:MAG: nucleoside triphosphate pyrophosphohydrolase family protein [Alphaproteobacteria bacterium]|nr:nucleoside triphosphate pyrophosphohydrolase family protein [Alphaproteobacteria bacterium]MCB1839024.1 nucleoside triphosphate pyrophosphohydrolase family protein [Alphaproteobacteria bacterium]